MKKITLLVAIMAVSFGFSQQVLLDDFETAGTLDAGFSGLASSSVVSDPEAGGTRGQVARLEVVAAAGDPWQGANVNLNTNVVLTTDKTIKMDIYSVDAIDLLVKVDNGVAGAPPSAVDVSHPGGSVWIETTVSFTTPRDNTTMNANGEYPTIAIFPNWNASPAPGTWYNPVVASEVYFDNIYGVAAAAPTCTDGIQNGDETGEDCGGSCPNVCETCDDGIMNNGETAIDCGGPNCTPCATPPTVPAPTPPARAIADVVSIYSNAYAAISPINYDAAWCGAGAVTATSVAGDDIFEYNNQDCQGINFASDLQDVTGLTNIHVDLFIQAGTDLVGKVFNMKIVPSVGAETAFNVDINALSPAPVPGTWYSYDATIALTGPTTDIKEFGVTSNLKNVLWYDNMYMYKGTPLSAESFNKVDFKAYPNPTQDSWTVRTESTQIELITVFNVLGKQVLTLSPDSNEVIVEGSSLKAGIYFAQIKTVSGINSVKLIKK